MTATAEKASVIDGGWKVRSNEPCDLDMGFNARRLRSNLQRNAVAMQALGRLGISPALVERVGLGIREAYVTAAGLEVSGVITYPLEASGGRRRYGYLALAGVTVNADHPVAWSPGDAKPVRHGDSGVLLVLPSPVAVLQARAAFERGGLAVSATASSQPDRIPAEWQKAAYWASWERIIVSDDVPSCVKVAVARAAMRPVEIAAGVADCGIGPSADEAGLDYWMEQMLSDARPFVIDASGDALQGGVGDYAASAISLHGGVAQGRMYYPFMIERRRHGGGGLVCSYETLVVRSDGAVIEARTLPAPPGTPAHQRVHCLTDGTRIVAAPAPSRTATWSFTSIQDFVASRGAGRDPAQRPSAEVLADVHAYLAARVTLSYPDDLWVVAAFVALTHMFRQFPSIPLLLIEGPRGSGKSELASVIASLGFNAATMGQGSAASLVRLAQDCGGLIVLDDAEGLSVGSACFGELSQCLKVGYRASTARKPITRGSGRVETFDFFGPRVLTCTQGIEPILRSRCITIPMTPRAGSRSLPAIDPNDLRDELHVLGMTSAGAVATAFASAGTGAENRQNEIWTPIMSIMQTLGTAEGVKALQLAKARHGS
ncbi:MAG: hypothetical protein EOO77_03980 [Oxalobacteraceae bacterium]|nr:MAG: hypothetical protein EOO77_03980 [Oxalobacteraceae bacterium]